MFAECILFKTLPPTNWHSHDFSFTADSASYKDTVRNFTELIAINSQDDDGASTTSTAIPEENFYDYIIVGAGPSGSIVARKLYEADSRLKILVLEAGTVQPQDPIFTNPKNWTMIQNIPEFEWGHATTYQKGMYGRSFALPRSPGLGGCTIHNSQLWVRGGRKAFDRWEELYGCKGWGWNDVLPLFHQLESTLNVKEVPKPRPFADSCIQAGLESGIDFTSNYNDDAGKQTGVAYTQYTILEDGRRENIYHIYLKQLADEGKVEVRCNQFVKRVIFSGAHEIKASGVVSFNTESRKQELFGARREVILTAGVFGSPQILMCSGIGRREHLEEASVECLVDSRGVGMNLHDDIFLPVVYKTREEVPDSFMVHGIGGAVIFPPENNTEITIQTNKMPGLFFVPKEWLQGFQIGADCHHPTSRGFMKLDPKNIYGLPIIDVNYLDSEEDVEQCVRAIKQIREIGETEALKKWGPVEVMPGPEVTSDSALRVFVRGTAQTAMHPAGTCRMGPQANPGSQNGLPPGGVPPPPVVDSDTLKVFGCEGLRVIDNSVFPENPHGNPAAAVFTVALKGAQMIIRELKTVH